MKKQLLLSALLICLYWTAQAQTPLRFGITGGLQSSKVLIGASGLSVNTSGLFGIHIGGNAEYAVNENVFIRPELLFSMKGGVFKDGSDSYKLSFSYLELPILALYKYEMNSGKLVGGAGPYFGFLAGGKIDGEAIDVGTDIKSLDAGLKLLGGYELTDSGLMINLFYNVGLASISPGSGGTIKNSTIGLSLTYFLGQR